MPNIANVLKAEIVRLARKESRDASAALKKTVAAQRAEIAQIKRQLQSLASVLRRLTKQSEAVSTVRRSPPSETSESSQEGSLRFRAQGMAANRKRLGLSAADFGLLIGASGQSVYAWEAGKAKPRGNALAAIAAVRGIRKREAQARLAELRASSSAP